MGRRRNRNRRRFLGKRKQGRRSQEEILGEENEVSIHETPTKSTSLLRMAKSAPITLEKKYLNESLNNININTPDSSLTRLNLLESRNSKNLNLLFAKVENHSWNQPENKETNYFRKIDNNLLESNQFFENTIKNCEKVKIDVATQTAQYEKTSFFNSFNHQSMPSFAQIFDTPKNNHMFDMKFSPKSTSASTPIMNNINDGFMLKFAEKRGLIQRNYSSFRVKKELSKNLAARNCMQINKRFSVNKPRCKSLSPKINKSGFVEFSTEKRIRGARNQEIPKSFSPIKRTSLRTNENFMNVRSNSKFGKVFTHIRNFNQKYSKKCLDKLIEVCGWLGLVMKEGFTNLYEISWVRSKGVQVSNQCNQCNELKEELAMIYKILENLSADVKDVKMKVGGMKTNCKEDVVVIPPPPPPPLFNNIPPPPPLPLLQIPINTVLKKTTRKPELVKEQNSRPVISVDALKSVKLKKPGERINRSLNTLRRNTQPVISLDMIKQVKLRPASKGSASASLSEVANSPIASSPGSTLTKLLTKGGDSSVKRLKRLKKRYTHTSNLDFFRNHQESPRERFQN